MSERRANYNAGRGLPVPMPMSFFASGDSVKGVMYQGKSSVGINFRSPQAVLKFVGALMEEAEKVWPELKEQR